MTAPSLLSHCQRAARRRAMADTVAIGLPGVLVAGALAGRVAGVPAGLGAAALASVLLAFLALAGARRFDRGWLIGALDARIPDFEDSSALLFRDPGTLAGFAALQRERLEARITRASAVDLRPGWSRRRIARTWGIAAAAILAIIAWPSPTRGPIAGARPADPAATPGMPAIAAISLRIVPPAYTGLPARTQRTLDARMPEGSRVEWTIAFAPPPSAAALVFPGGGEVPLAGGGARRTGARIVARPALYRIAASGMARQRLHRLDTVADAPPVVGVVAPDGQLALVTPGQSRWTPVFEATDDYGVSAAATLRITVTQGDGENVTFDQRAMALRGRGAARRRRFSATLDLAREGMAPGSDMIVQLVVTDDRAPRRHMVEGPSVILRWPADLGLADGMDGMMQRVMPAYFRSQRQIIIDAEALIAGRRRIDADRFVDRSNALGIDQAQLRLRYGQFAGEEGAAGGGGIALPTDDAPALPTNDGPAPAPPTPQDDHDHAAEAEPPAFGSDVDAVGAFGHAHDDGDAAALSDRGTRSTLGLALDAMWDSERALRQGKPGEALPFAYRALEYLKEAQQATRIFLARTGPDLPPVDMARRLTGDRDGIAGGMLARTVRDPVDAPPAAAWRALEERPGGRGALRLGALDRWVRDHRARLADPLALAAAIDTVRGEPNCLACRRRLRALLWGVLERPPAAVRRREPPAPRGRRYLDALR